ncbi:MAG: phosphopentomutase [Clostridia bacterium]|nr:phosphopentomutase [Clostridia bacterium]
MFKRVFLIVLDSFGVGEAPDAARFGDEGSDTLGAVRKHPNFDCPNLTKLGLFNIDGVGGGIRCPHGAYGKMRELSNGKDTVTGHWEIAGLISEKPMPLYPEGFPDDVISEFERLTGRGVLCNKPYSGTEVLKDYGEEHIRTGKLIVYTSGDSVFQIAAHKDVVPLEELYRYCEIARGMLTGKHSVGRVIARPFVGEYPFIRTAERHDYSLEPPRATMLDAVSRAGLEVISVGKIVDIFAGRGITDYVRTVSNNDGMTKTAEIADRDFHGLCFVNLVDFDSAYGHRNDVPGYAAALTAFDRRLPEIMNKLGRDDMLIITADHGCDPSTPSTDHSREYVPLLISGDRIKYRKNLHTMDCFGTVAATVLEALGISDSSLDGSSVLESVLLNGERRKKNG